MERVGEIESPEVLYLGDVGCSAVDGVDCFVDQIPIVVNLVVAVGVAVVDLIDGPLTLLDGE